ncbi:kinase-like domain-containing protein [Phaeosphaeria sp. MPI-PUGE-AT-0046c]|nr:kinase-like domain-containing protein [Phaeosphaeria sp. MPI-PUGE-AT-0046c]
MRSKFKIQDRPRRQWVLRPRVVVKDFGQNGGGLNGGIAKVELKDDPYDRYFIEKRFNQQQVNDPYFAEKEITLLHQVQDHENVTQYVDHYLDRRERQIWKWFIGCTDALSYCHYGPKPDDVSFRKKYWNQIYHRDIKPGNIFLKLDGKKGEIIAKLADFGCSVSGQWTKLNKAQELASRASAHTPGYDPPEHPEFSVLTDVWQLALSFACVCTGTMRPRSKTAPYDEKWDKQQPAGRHYTSELNEVLRWCLNQDKYKRPDSLTVVKRLKETYSRLDSRLPLIDRPTNVYWQAAVARQTYQPPSLSSPGPRTAGMPAGVPSRRPRPPVHAFSDPSAERMNQMENRYQAFGPGQRTPMSPNSIDQIVQDGGGRPVRRDGRRR